MAASVPTEVDPRHPFVGGRSPAGSRHRLWGAMEETRIVHPRRSRLARAGDQQLLCALRDSWSCRGLVHRKEQKRGEHQVDRVAHPEG